MNAIGLGIFLISLAATSSAIPLVVIKDRALPQICVSSADCEAANLMCFRAQGHTYGHCLVKGSLPAIKEVLTTLKQTTGVTVQSTKTERPKRAVINNSVPASGLETDVDVITLNKKICQSSTDCDAINQVCSIPNNKAYGHCTTKESQNTITPRPAQGVPQQVKTLGQRQQLYKRLQRNSDWVGKIRSQLQSRIPSSRGTTKQYRKRSLNLDLDLDTALDKTLSDLSEVTSKKPKVGLPMPGNTKASLKKSSSGKNGNPDVNVKGDVEIHVTHHVIHTTADNRTIGNSSNTSRVVKISNLHGLETNWRRIIDGKHDLLNASLPRQELNLHEMGTLLSSVAEAIKHDINRDPFKQGGDKYHSGDFTDIQKKNRRGHDHSFKYDDADDLRHKHDLDNRDDDDDEEEEEDDDDDDGNESEEEEEEEEEDEEDEDEEDELEDVKRKRKRSLASNASRKNMKGAHKHKRSLRAVAEAVETVFSDDDHPAPVFSDDDHTAPEKSKTDSDHDINRDPFKQGGDKNHSGDFTDIQKKNRRGHDHSFKYDDADDLRHKHDLDNRDDDEEEEEDDDDDDGNESEEEEEEEEEEDEDEDEEDEDEEDELEDVKRKRKRSLASNASRKNMKGAHKHKRSLRAVAEAVETVFSDDDHPAPVFSDDDHTAPEKSKTDSDEKSDRDRRNIGSLEELSPVSHPGTAIEQDRYSGLPSNIPPKHADMSSPMHVPSHQEDSQPISASSQWSECSVTCGLGTRRKTKACADMNCTPGQIQIKPCMMPIC